MKRNNQGTTCYTCLNMNLLKLRFPKVPEICPRGNPFLYCHNQLRNRVSLCKTSFPDVIELDDGKMYRKPLYLMVKTMVSCRFPLNQSIEDATPPVPCRHGDVFCRTCWRSSPNMMWSTASPTPRRR